MLIKRGGVHFHSQIISTGNNPDGTARPKQTIGTLYELPELSANHCKMLESDALQSEFEEKQRNDPKNWSQFRQQYEAFRSMKEIISEPAERIPEEWVRNTIARIHGIKPEHVTLKQIAFEVSGLLSSTNRHIEMIPSRPPESPSAPDAKPTDQAEPSAAPEQTVAEQIQRLREECRWTIEQLAEATSMSTSAVARHLSRQFMPYDRNICSYERAFSKQLKRQIVIKKMP